MATVEQRKHEVAETPEVKQALDALREQTGSDRVDLEELVVLGAREKLDRLEAEDERKRALRTRLADRIRNGDLGIDQEAVAELERLRNIPPRSK